MESASTNKPGISSAKRVFIYNAIFHNCGIVFLRKNSNMYDSHFSLDNIPFGIASRSSGEVPTVVTRLYNNVIFLQLVAENGLLPMVSAETVITFSKVRPILNY
jgi:hypothetical protein